MQDFPLVFLSCLCAGGCLWRPCDSGPFLPLSNPPSPSEVPAQGVGSSLKLHEATPSRARLHLGPPRLTATLRVGACALLLASFARICLAAQFPTSTGLSPPRWLASAPLEKVWFLLTVGVLLGRSLLARLARAWRPWGWLSPHCPGPELSRCCQPSLPRRSALPTTLFYVGGWAHGKATTRP